MKNKEIEKLKEEFRDIFWPYHFKRNTKLNDKESEKRLKELSGIFKKEGVKTI